jgi:hypothetical protein
LVVYFHELHHQFSIFDAIFIIVDRLTKMTHFVLCKKSITREEVEDSLWIIFIRTMDYLMISY